jgi:hypothetical protein
VVGDVPVVGEPDAPPSGGGDAGDSASLDSPDVEEAAVEDAPVE